MRELIETLIDLSIIANKKRLLAAIGSMTGLYHVELRPRRNTLTNAQRGFFHGAIVKEFFNFRNDQGESFTFDECKQDLKFRFLRETRIDKKTGEIVGEFVRSTESLDIAEYSVFIEKCLAFLAEFGIVVSERPPAIPPQPAGKAEDF